MGMTNANDWLGLRDEIQHSLREAGVCEHRNTTMIQVDDDHVQDECEDCGQRLGARYVY